MLTTRLFRRALRPCSRLPLMIPTDRKREQMQVQQRPIFFVACGAPAIFLLVDAAIGGGIGYAIASSGKSKSSGSSSSSSSQEKEEKAKAIEKAQKANEAFEKAQKEAQEANAAKAKAQAEAQEANAAKAKAQAEAAKSKKEKQDADNRNQKIANELNKLKEEFQVSQVKITELLKQILDKQDTNQEETRKIFDEIFKILGKNEQLLETLTSDFKASLKQTEDLSTDQKKMLHDMAGLMKLIKILTEVSNSKANILKKWVANKGFDWSWKALPSPTQAWVKNLILKHVGSKDIEWIMMATGFQ